MDHFKKKKLVRCIKGSVCDYVLDLRKKIENFYEKIISIKLDENNFNSVYVPRGYAHGYITLKNNTILSYLTTNYYSKTHERSFSFFHKKLNIRFPIKPSKISKKDLIKSIKN